MTNNHPRQAAGCIFIDENGEGPGVRLKKTPQATADKIDALENKIANIPVHSEPSPEAGLDTMRKALAENDLAELKSVQSETDDPK